MTDSKLKGRAAGIDLFRLIAFWGVVLIHTANFSDENRRSLGQYIVSICHFAVPYFFIVSGYFQKNQGFLGTAHSLFRRLVPTFIAWGIFYFWFFNGTLIYLLNIKIFLRFLYTGLPAYHLWFIPALISATLIFSVARSYLDWRGLFSLAVMFYIVGLLLGPYHEIVGLSASPFGTRNGPWFSLLYVTLGKWWQTSARPELTLAEAIMLVLVTAAAQIAEDVALFNVGLTQAISGPDMTIMTVPFGAAVFALARAAKLNAIGAWLARGGSAAFGMYLIHAVFVLLAQNYVPPFTLTARLADAAIAFLASAAVALLMVRIPLVKALVK